ncbi:MAG: amino acid permease [Clostridia bacterium]|nr:amino acid permease [Clostridia bacterium]
MSINAEKRGLTKYLSPLGAWALAFGCAVGWGSFVMPGNTFLPIAGPIGTVLGIGIGAVIMLLLAANYHFLMNKYPEAGGAYAYTKYIFGYDHGFLNAWFLILTYVAIIWANATALPLIGRNLLGSFFQVGLHYQIAGFDVYMGEVLLAVAALAVAAAVCLFGRSAGRAQIVLALVLLGGVTVCVLAAALNGGFAEGALSPAYAPDRAPLSGVFTIIALAPWAYVGFESICHSSEEFQFSPKKSFRVLAVAVVTAGAAYAMLALLAVAVLPEGCASWTDYIFGLGSRQGIEGLPTFFGASSVLGGLGVVLLGLAALAGILTGLIGNYIASSRLLYALAQDSLLPGWFGKLDKHRVPKNAVLFLLAVSALLPFLGRTAVAWIVDVTTVGATIAYAYTSASALRAARKEKNKLFMLTGGAGVAVSLAFILYFLIPHLLDVTVLSTESYLILAAWGILGFVFFLYAFRKDYARHLGRSTIAWIVLLAMIIFTSTIWMREATQTNAEQAVTPIQTYYAERLREEGVDVEAMDAKPVRRYLEEKLEAIGQSLTAHSLVQTGLILAALAMLFYIYSLMQKREKQLEREKVLAEESSRAKTSFLSNMSHEIRTPMNAIIGLDSIALKDPNLSPHTREQLEKIGSSAKHLLGLINDILDMSRIESGRMVLKNEEFSFRAFLDQINVMINSQCMEKGLEFECHIIGHVNDYYVGDDMKLKQVLINILGNAVKFTPAPGSVTFTVEQPRQFEGYCTLRFTVADTGIGMSKEYLPKIFDAFSQEDSSISNRHGSTGLGMAITKNIVNMMNGDIAVESEKGKGSTFTVTVTLKSSPRSVHQEHGHMLPENLRVLIVDDSEVACKQAQMVAADIGIKADAVMTGEDALGRVLKRREEGVPYHLVITDYKMPGMDGLALTRAIRAFDKGETGVIILTGYSWEDIQEECNKIGVDGIMSKPLFTDSLLFEAQRVLEKKRQDANSEETPAVPAGAEEAPEAGEGSLQGLRVLLAEDMEINAEILTDLLDMEGISAEHAENGQIAVDMFSAHPAGFYDAVLMDVRMPVMDGLEAARALRALDRPDAKTIPIIALTANAFDEDVQRSLQAGMNAHLSKPVEPDRLYETLRRLIRAAE